MFYGSNRVQDKNIWRWLYSNSSIIECLLYAMYVSVCFICVKFSALHSAPVGQAPLVFPFIGEEVEAQ